MNIKSLKTERIEKIFRSFLKQNPNPTTELNYNNHFELLIAVMLSAHTTDVSVNKATPLLFQKAPTARGYAKIRDYCKNKKTNSNYRTL